MGRKNQVLEKVFDRFNIKVDKECTESYFEEFTPTYEMTEEIQKRLEGQK